MPTACSSRREAFDVSTKPTVLVTGDIVLDCHLYGGVKTAATSFSEPGTAYRQEVGGAALSCRLLNAAARASAAEWDAKKTEWEFENAKRKKKEKEPLPWPMDLPEVRPEFDAHLAFDTAGLDTSLPQHLRSYGVWTDRPARRGARDRVWRVEAVAVEQIFKPNRARPIDPPVLTLIDDGAILFRHGVSDTAWPELSATGDGWYLLKMSSPLCRGDLWAALAPVMDRLVVVVSVADLRREDIQIARRLSWERSVEDTLSALQYDPTAHDLLRAAHVIVGFRSAGVLWIHRGPGGQHSARLLFDPVLMEGDYKRDFEGTTYGFQTCVAAGIAHRLMNRHAAPGKNDDGTPRPSPFRCAQAMGEALQEGIAAGLTARRRLLELGHGPVSQEKPPSPNAPGFPVDAIGKALAKSPGGFVRVAVSAASWGRTEPPWTIVGQSELAGGPPAPLIGLALLTARYGTTAVSHVPALRLGRFFTVDRSEIESLRTLDALVRSYEATRVQKKPLCIGVFGPPGAGKSFGVKALAQAILGENVPFLEFNLSQFKHPDELIGAFHRVRDAVLEGRTPVAFWDEFDSQQYRWLQYLLAPMQDGGFQEGQITHPIGKCIFVFAGGTSPTLQAFGVPEPAATPQGEPGGVQLEDRAARDREIKEQRESYRAFKLLKGPDFISRLEGFLNVLGPNPRTGPTGSDITWPIRRALTLRGLLGLADSEVLEIDPGLLYALVSVSTYRHGVRSFEKVVKPLAQGRDGLRVHRSALPPDAALDRETDAAEFRSLMEQRNAFKNEPDIEILAAAVHQRYLDEAEKARLKAEISKRKADAWNIHPEVMKAYDDLSEDKKASNRAAARRIPDHLALINFVVVKKLENDDDSWKAPLTNAIERHVERLAQAEHLGWSAERTANGWSYGDERDDKLKRHPLLVDWARLSPSDQDKDRSGARSIPLVLDVAGFKAVPAGSTP
jgi:hypothetical protein